MPTRRALLRAGGAAALAALAGCQSSRPTAFETTDPTSAGAGEYRLDAESVAPGDVPDDATAGVASPDLHELVADAAESDDRVDPQSEGVADSEETLALAAFAYLEFGGETYEPTASFARFGEEAIQTFDLVPVGDEEVGEDVSVTDYESLNDTEQAAAKRLVNESITVGRHEEGRPDGVGGVVTHEYLRVGNDTYQSRIIVGDPPAHHMLELDAADPAEDAQVVTVLDERPEADWSSVLEEALDSGSVGMDGVPADEALVEYLRRVDYVVTATRVLDVSVTQTVQ